MKNYFVTTTCLLIVLGSLIYEAKRVQDRLHALDQKIVELEALAVLDAKCEQLQAEASSYLIDSLAKVQEQILELKIQSELYYSPTNIWFCGTNLTLTNFWIDINDVTNIYIQ